MGGDIDNIVKPILDALKGVAFIDDKAVERVLSQEFEPDVDWSFQYESKGFTFVTHPQSSDVPGFLGTYRPDAVVLKDDQRIAIEVKTRPTQASERSLREIRRLFDGQDDWEFTVAYMGASPYSSTVIPLYDASTIGRKINEASSLADQGHFRPAFIMAWSLLEAAMHRSVGGSQGRPTTPGTVVQSLAMHGLLEPDTERQMRLLIELRNRIVHGDLEAEPTATDVSLVLGAVAGTLQDQPA